MSPAIPLTARILQVVDIYDALITARPYKPSFEVDQVFSIMKEEAEKGWRDPEMLEHFINLLEAGEPLG